MQKCTAEMKNSLLNLLILLKTPKLFTLIRRTYVIRIIGVVPLGHINFASSFFDILKVWIEYPVLLPVFPFFCPKIILLFFPYFSILVIIFAKYITLLDIAYPLQPRFISWVLDSINFNQFRRNRPKDNLNVILVKQEMSSNNSLALLKTY